MKTGSSRIVVLALSVVFSLGSTPRSIASSTGNGTSSQASISLPVQQENVSSQIPEMPADETVHLFWHPSLASRSPLSAGRIQAAELGLTGEQANNPKDISRAFLTAYAAPLKVANAELQWDVQRMEQVDDLGVSQVFLQQMYKDRRVFAGEIVVHVKDSAVVAANGEYLSNVTVSTKPTLSAGEAFKSAMRTLGLTKPVQLGNELVVYNPALLDLGESANYLAYVMTIETKEPYDSVTALINAHTGKVMLRYSNLLDAKNREIRDLNGSTNTPGPVCYTEAGLVGNPSTDCRNAFNFSGDWYNYFSTTHGRDSFNGSGATLRASVRYSNDANAFWNGTQVVFGPGFATKDVVAHEWSHAVTQYTADLVYSNQSGALNESFSDIFGAMVDRDDWLIGEDTPGGAFRSMADPTIYSDPGKVSDSQFYCGAGDNGGVHTNSGVQNHAAYLMSDGGNYNGRTITSIGRDRTERIFYRALTHYLTSGSNFSAAYNALVASCGDLYGSSSTYCTSTTAALQATEMNAAVCSAIPATPDVYETDNGYAQAKVINTTQPNHNFHIAGDQDWAKFTASTGWSYVIDTYNLGSNSDTYMELYDVNGATMLTFNDDGGGGYASRIGWTAPANGVYYIMVRHYSPSVYGNTTSYDLRITDIPPATGPDIYEPDNTTAQAKGIAIGSTQSHNFHTAGDLDWAYFTAIAGGNYSIQTLNLGSSCDTYLSLYSVDGATLLASNDDGGGGYASRIDWTAPANGAYYVMVRHYNSAMYGAGTGYDLNVMLAPSPPDAYEPDNTSGQAGTIVVNGSAQAHTFHVINDQDWVKFTATASSVYVIETLNLGSRDDTVLTLYDTNGVTQLVTNDDGGGGLASRIAWTAPASGVYYAMARQFFGGLYGPDTNYDLRVTGTSAGETPDSFEPDNTAAQAKTITVNGAAQSHNFHTAADTDWVKFTADIGMDYVIETLNLGGNCDTVLYLYGTDGATSLAFNDDSSSGLASRITWNAPASGVYYVLARHFSPSIYGANTNYDLQVTATGVSGGPDLYEDDDAAARASVIATNGIQTHNFHDSGDLDWVKFTAVAGSSYVIETFNLGSRTDTYLYLYDTNGATQLAADDDSGDGVASRIGWTAPAGGVYYLMARHFSPSVYGANTNYDLRVSDISSTGADRYEPDNTAATARVFNVNDSTQTHNFQAAGDQDWVKFTATTGVAYTIQTSNLGGNCDTILYLYGSDGVTLITANDDGGGGMASRITWIPGANGLYYVMVRHYNSNAYGANTNYDLSITGSSVPGDAYEPDNSASQASTITAGSTQGNHDFHSAGDADWTRFTAAAGNGYVIQTLNLGSNCDTVMTLYAQDGATQLAYNDDGGGGTASRIDWTAPANGDYYVMVRHFNSATYGAGTNYDLRLMSAGTPDAYEPDDSANQASTINAGSAQTSHNFHFAGDVDWARFTATGGFWYTIQTLNLGSASDTVLYLYGADGTTLLASNDDGGGGRASRIDWNAPLTGTFYVMVRHYNSSAYGNTTNYDLSVASSGPGSTPDSYEPDNTYAQAQYLNIGGTQANHNFHVGGDQDWVSFSASAGVAYTIQTLNLGASCDTYLTLYDVNGTSILTTNDDGGGGTASRIDWSAPANGTYYAMVRHFSNSAYGPSTNYDVRITTARAALAPAAVVVVAGGPFQPGGEVEATIYIREPAAQVKVDVYAKDIYLRTVEAAPLTLYGKLVGERVTADADRWQQTLEQDGHLALFYAGKPQWDGNDSQPIVRLRWQLVGTPPYNKIVAPIVVTLIGQDGQVTIENTQATVVILGSEPKINNVDPLTVTNDVDTVISIQASNFVMTPKIYLHSATDDIPLADVGPVPDPNAVRATVPAGTKPGVYKLRLENPDNSTAEYAGTFTVKQLFKAYVPIIQK